MHAPEEAAGIVAELGPAADRQAGRRGLQRRHEQGHGGDELPAAFAEARRWAGPVLVEEWVSGGEYSVGVLQGEVLPAVRIETPRAFYDYEAKYFSDETRYHCPCGLEPAREAEYAAQVRMRVRRRGGVRLGARGFPAARGRRAALPRGQHHSRHDQPQPGADGRAPGRHRLRRAGVASARDQLRAARHERGGARVARRPGPGAAARPASAAGFFSRESWRMPRLPAWPWKTLATGAVTAAALGAGLWGAGLLLDRPIRQVIVQGPFERVSVLQIEAAVGDLREAGFLSVSLDAVRAKIVAIDWVDDAVVRRRWPAEVEIIVREQVPAARWGDSGLLNTRGELFVRDARHMPPELPQLSGPEGTEQLVARRYLDARATLAAVGFRLRALELDARGSWRIELSNGLQLRLGRESFERRLRRFARVAAPLLTPRGGEVAYVDMRYSRGFAVGWREAAPR
jgi:cell division protein FtsQ